MTNWDDVDLFCHVVEHGGFSAAARTLGRPKSSLSAALRRLEQALHVRLLERTTRRLRLTEAGEGLYHATAPLFAGLREARGQALARREGVAGVLSVAAPYEFGAHHVGPVLTALMREHPQLSAQLDVEHTSTNPFDQRHDVVFAMVEGELPPSSIVARRMYAIERWLFAAPELLARHQPRRAEELAALPLLAGAGDSEWRFTTPEGGSVSVPVAAPRLRSGNADVRLQAAAEGLGVARVTATFGAALVQAGRLRRVLADHVNEPLRVYALLPAKRLMPEKVRVFLDALAREAAILG
jgi:DNA-binding transcriptional LysR family regulator